MKQFIYWLNYFHAPAVKEKSVSHLVLESIRNKVWNPVFTIGVITFVLSMTLRGFFDQHLAIIPLAISTFVLFSGVWILSASALVVFDNTESKIYFVYKHLGYLQKIYSYPLTSVDAVELIEMGNGKFRLQLQKDDGSFAKVAEQKDQNCLQSTAMEISSFLSVPMKK